MAEHKPLPALPATHNLLTLSIDARAHRARLIRHILSEVADPVIQSRFEGWARTIEEALDELSSCISRGDWLAGIRRRRELQLRARLDSLLAERTLQPESKKDPSKENRPQSPASSNPQPPPSLAFPSVDDTQSNRTRDQEVLQQLRAHVSRHNVPTTDAQQFHLLLCLAPCTARVHFPAEDHGFDVIPGNVSCIFVSSRFSLPSDVDRIETAVLYGIKEWDDSPSLRIVGGTFSFKGDDTLSQHQALAQVLRISVYIHLSLLLEQHFLADSHVPIKFPRPQFSFPSSLAPSENGFGSPSGATEGFKDKPPSSSSRSPFLPPGILSFFSRKKGLSHRAQTVNQTGSRGSLDLISNASELVQDEPVTSRSPRRSIDDSGAGTGVSRLRRFSFMGGHERRPSLRRAPPNVKDTHMNEPGHPESTDGPFTAALKRVERSRSLLSTSFGVTFFPPSLLVDLAEKETRTPNRRLKGDEKAALAGILGWTGKDAAGRGMSGVPGFVRQQEFSFLQSLHVPASQLPPSSPTPTHSGANSDPQPSSSSSALTACTLYPNASTLCCGRPQWLTYRYFSPNPTEDQRLGEAILELLSTADMPCATPGCTFKTGEHEKRIVHGGFRITIKIRDAEGFDLKEKERQNIDMWETCRICEKETERSEMTNGTYLFSYAKFLELLIYSSSIYVLSPSLCEHTTPSPPPPNPSQHPPSSSSSTSPSASHPTTQSHPHVPESRLNIIRHFSVRNATVSFSLSIVDDIFELRVPRLQINGGSELERERGGRMEKIASSADHHPNGTTKGTEGGTNTGGGGIDVDAAEEDKKVLRREIKRWWEGITDHMDKLERLLASDTSDSSSFKKLPRLPSVDDAYDDLHVAVQEGGTGEEEDATRTPRAVPLKELPSLGPGVPPNTPESQVSANAGDEEDVTKTPTRSRNGGSGQLGVHRADEDEEKTPTIEEAKEPSIITTSADDVSPEIAATTSVVSVSTSTSTVSTPTPTPSILTSSTSEDRDPRELLENLRQTFQRAEHDLYVQLSRTPENMLNDVRRAFVSTAKGAQKRLGAWQRKHLAGLVNGKSDGGGGSKARVRVDEEVLKELGVKDVKELLMSEGKGSAGLVKCAEPEWWAGGCHVVPGSSVIVREDDWGSIIAFTLSSPDYHRELANLAVNRTAPSTSPPPTPPPAPSRNHSAGPSSFFTTTTGKLFGTSTNPQPDPDRDDVVWHEPEPYSAVISRKEHPRDQTSILSIREVLRHKSPAIDPSTGLPLSGTGKTSSSNSDSQQTSLALASVYAKPDVKVSMQAAGGEVSVTGTGAGQKQGHGQVVDAVESAGKILHEIEAVVTGEGGSSGSRPDTAQSRKTHTGSGSGDHTRYEGTDATKHGNVTLDAHAQAPRPTSPASDYMTMSTSSYVDMHIRRGNAESILSFGSEATMSRRLERAPTPPPKDRGENKGTEETKKSPATSPTKDLPGTPSGSVIHQPTPSSSSFANTIASSLNMAMRFVLNQPDRKSPSVNPPPPVPKKKPHHNLLLVDLNNIDERPHIKYDWTIGKRLKFSCTVYYARQFDLLRKRCGIDDTFLKSLERSVNWTAVGGKSRSNFWKTLDERFIIKTLVNAWNVADLQVLIELAPSYFRYIESTASKATVLAKLIGFYTIEIRNLETGTVQSKADLLVMENLFYNRKINKTFDLKGIQGRKVKAKQNRTEGSKTLFDNEWIEGQQRTLMLLQPHSKRILREAIRSDADFLARSNIMDYSLLLGIDEEKKQIACGLVDTIGSYTFAKTLEYKAKHNLQSGKNVTVVPPAEYQERFVNALEDYFLACPDKWSKPLDESKIVSDPFLLPSVL